MNIIKDKGIQLFQFFFQAFRASFTYCLNCQGPSERGGLCRDCLKRLPWLDSCCIKCALPLSSPKDTVCASCQDQPLPFFCVRALFRYEPPISHFMSGLKFKEKICYARLFGELLRDSLKGIMLPQAILPVPLHTNRLRQRGFNQAIEIAKPIVKAYKIPLLVDNCIRQIDTPQQLKLDASSRRKLPSKIFCLKHPIPYHHVAILDDVMTTGSTALALYEVLKRAGVEKIEFWTVCRA